jgi:site-specific DNA-methyltransferase (adenine-specific)
MKPYWENNGVIIYNGNCLDILPSIQEISAVVTDPPYEIGFMGKAWDSRGVSFSKDTWSVIRNSCKPGAMMLTFGGTRTFHRIAVAIEDGGWEFRDTIMWLYGSGFPKSYDIGKGVEGKLTSGSASWNKWRELDGEKEPMSWGMSKGQANQGYRPSDYTEANQQRVGKVDFKTEEGKLWDGWGTALKPAFEPILVCMNPLDGTFANNALKHGVAGINIDGCRVEYKEGEAEADIGGNFSKAGKSYNDSMYGGDVYLDSKTKQTHAIPHTQGRFPANIIHDGSQMVLDLFPNSKGELHNKPASGIFGNEQDGGQRGYSFKDNGSAARFFYCAKSSKSERNKGCEDMDDAVINTEDCTNLMGYRSNLINTSSGKPHNVLPSKNSHPTVKPLALMEYLCKLVKMPEYNLILDPFVGSGTTLLACIRLGIPCIGIDSDEKSCEIAAKRCSQEVMELGV